MISEPSLEFKAAAVLELRRRQYAVQAYDASFEEFIRAVNPKLEFYTHVQLLVDTLQQVADGEISRLMVFEPPRHGKSELVSRLFSAYYVRRYPDRFVGLNSYSAELAYTLSRNARSNFAESGGVFASDAGAVKQWETRQGGGMWAAGVGGSITGKGFHLGLIDDPLKNAQDAASITIRESQKDWYDSTFYTRAEPDAAIVVVQTRWHDDDLSGWLLGDKEVETPEHWHILALDAIRASEPIEIPETCIRVTGDKRKAGEALCPERYPIHVLEQIKSTLQGRGHWDPLYQQRPTSADGDVFSVSWWDIEMGRNRYHYDDKVIAGITVSRFIHIDTAIKDKDSSDYTAAAVVEFTADYRMLLREVWRDRVHSSELPFHVEAIAARWNQDGLLRGIIIEDKASGPTVIGTLRRSSPTWIAELVQEFQPIGTKVERARQASVWCWRDCVKLPYPSEHVPWLHDFADERHGELFRFPMGKNDDQVDAFSQAIIHGENLLSSGWHARNSPDETKYKMTPAERMRARLASKSATAVREQ